MKRHPEHGVRYGCLAYIDRLMQRKTPLLYFELKGLVDCDPETPVGLACVKWIAGQTTWLCSAVESFGSRDYRRIR